MTVRTRCSGGFTLVEMLIVTVILGILAGLALPSLQQAVYKADAAKIVSDVRNVDMGIRAYVVAKGSLPASAPWGKAPPSLAGYIPEAIDWTYKTTSYRLVTQKKQNRTRLIVRYPRNDPVGTALKAFRGTDVTWTKTRTTFWLER